MVSWFCSTLGNGRIVEKEKFCDSFADGPLEKKETCKLNVSFNSTK